MAATQQGLYQPSKEKDACGVGFITSIRGQKSHQIIKDALKILCNLEHRGAVGADPRAGDGAGIMIQIPHRFFVKTTRDLGFTLPDPGDYAVGHLFLPSNSEGQQIIRTIVERVVREEGQTLLGWRPVPTDDTSLGDTVKPSQPVHLQMFIGRNRDLKSQDDFERRLYIIRKVISNAVYGTGDDRLKGYYTVCLSSRTLIYKGMFLADQLAEYYPDLSDPDMESALALVHQRFSTNTFPSWQLAHPYRMVAHNGEINTLRGNVNWMAARQASVDSEVYDNDISKLWPISYEGQSDTACFDNALEFLVQGGYSLAHAMTMLVPEAWAGNPLMDEGRRAYYEYHAALMEPWDGPAAIAFTDGRQIGATLDRNGLRPARYFVTKDERLILASEMGVLDIPEDQIVSKWRLQPGKMLLVDFEQGRIITDDEIKWTLSQKHPYREWLQRTQIVLEDLRPVEPRATRTDVSLLDRQQAFGYTQEDIKLLMVPMAVTGQEAVGSMGVDTPISALSRKPRLLYSYFKQNFAQVTNPPIDPIREELVMSLVSFIGPRPNLFDREGTSRRKRLEVRQPILTNGDLEKIRSIGMIEERFDTRTLDMTYPVEKGVAGFGDTLERLCERAEAAVLGGYNIIILSDRQIGPDRIAIPSLLATAAVHAHLIRKGLRTSVGLVVETGDAREIHHVCCLAGYGAEAINPWLAFDTLKALKDATTMPEQVTEDEIVTRYIKAIDKGILKVMSKMGISTYQSYCGAQIFDALGLKQDLVDRYFFGTASPIEGAGLEDIARETVERHALAFGDNPLYQRSLDVGGEYAFRLRGETHLWTPDSIATLQHAVRTQDSKLYEKFTTLIDHQQDTPATLRDLMEIVSPHTPVPIEEVEPAAQIVRRFATGAMSFGSISREAHETLALAMNRIGGKSNTGEGGEEPERLKSDRRSAIKQIASGRFGVTAEYLVNADVLQIKVAQGAKPGEGGQLPGFKVDATIAKVRHSTPGVGLISPPPHHDIYSIEDLAQLIFDLKNVNPQAQISVKLVAEAGVGTVAAGVAKARADHITISGYEGGTGASPLTSIRNAGLPWEIGLAETHQTLLRNRLRTRVALQVDGGLRTGRDVIIGALLGADEFGFATAPLIATGCLMMRKCHLNTCPVGVATQDPVLRKRFKGTPEHVINYMFFVAEDVRRLMAELGVRKFEDLIGRSDWLRQQNADSHAKADGIDLSRLFFRPDSPEGYHHSQNQNHPLEDSLDRKLIEQCSQTITEGSHAPALTLSHRVASRNRAVGAMLSGEVARHHGHAGLPEDTITIHLTGTAGQSFGAFLAAGITLRLEGEANDYVGKGLSGGKIIIQPPHGSGIIPEQSIIVGNTAFYGAIAGESYIRGIAGERFAVRNSGASIVVEGLGDHGCEYMTGGVIVVLGPTGRNFAAGMSGGIAYVLDEQGDFARRCNLSMVDLEPVEQEEVLTEELYGHTGDIEFKGRIDVLSAMSGGDSERLQTLLRNHCRYTGSEKAQRVLDDWAGWQGRFVKVMPVEYRQAIREMERSRSSQAAE